MLLRDFARAAREDLTYDVMLDGDRHELTRDEILGDDGIGTHDVTRWFVGRDGVVNVESIGNYADMGYVTATQAAEMLGVSRMRVNQMIHEGKLEAEKGGFSWMVRIESVERGAGTSYEKANDRFGRWYDELGAWFGDFHDEYDHDAIKEELWPIMVRKLANGNWLFDGEIDDERLVDITDRHRIFVD